ncbi:MAG: neutral amino acid transporter [Piccolia ochrophora]|nr:MAG: neutral amino acid transporter [Piccolia ochrophora]
MSEPQGSPSSASRPLPVPRSSSPQRGRLSPGPEASRATSTARLASPVSSSAAAASPAVRQIPTPSQLNNGDSPSQTPLPGAENAKSLPGPGHSALAAAFQGSLGQTPPVYGTPPTRPLSPPAAGAALLASGPQSTYGSFERRSVQGGTGWAGPTPLERRDVVKRHLVQASEGASKQDDFDDGESSNRPFATRDDSSRSDTNRDHATVAPGLDEDEFSSLQLQGGDMTRQVYRWSEEAEAQASGRGRGQRSRSFHISRPQPESETLDINNIKAPGGFRRDYLRRIADSPSSSRQGSFRSNGAGHPSRRPPLFTGNFIEFLSLYGHFAGEELEEDDEVLRPDEYFSSDAYDDLFRSAGEGEEDDDSGREPGEDSALLTPGTPGKRRRRRKDRGVRGTNGTRGAILLLLKSFVGTGVLFLPRAFLNGGMLFSIMVLVIVSPLSYYCFILLVTTRLKVEGSFGDLGSKIYGRHMRAIIQFSIVLSQVGFSAAYIVFTSENLQAFVLAVSHGRTWIDIKFMILMQLIVFLPLSLFRDISKLGATALIADALILLGLIYLYYFDLFTIVSQQGVSDIALFNPSNWTLFIGTAIFTFEGIGLIIPIQESMRKPTHFPRVLGGVMIIITLVFTSMGALSYAAFGSATKTVVLLNLPQDNRFVNGVQFLYSLAILLSTPLQLFPAIRITENEFFTRSGKYNPYIKWQKNVFRFFMVMLTSAIAWGGADDLDKFVALVGSFACVPLVYVYPPLLHYRAIARSRTQRIIDLSLVVFGFIVMIYTTTLTLMVWAASPAKGGKHGAG